MAKQKGPKLPPKLQEWVDARARHHLSHAHVQMARELGFLPKSLRKIDDHQGKLWKMPLKDYIEHLYFKRFGRERPETVRTIEQVAKDMTAKKDQQKANKEPQPELSSEAQEKPTQD